MSEMRDLEDRFDRACGLLFGELLAGEALAVDFAGESSRLPPRPTRPSCTRPRHPLRPASRRSPTIRTKARSP
jgi:hypothetical protein